MIEEQMRFAQNQFEKHKKSTKKTKFKKIIISELKEKLKQHQILLK